MELCVAQKVQHFWMSINKNGNYITATKKMFQRIRTTQIADQTFQILEPQNLKIENCMQFQTVV